MATSGCDPRTVPLDCSPAESQYGLQTPSACKLWNSSSNWSLPGMRFAVNGAREDLTAVTTHAVTALLSVSRFGLCMMKTCTKPFIRVRSGEQGVSGMTVRQVGNPPCAGRGRAVARTEEPDGEREVTRRECIWCV